MREIKFRAWDVQAKAWLLLTGLILEEDGSVEQITGYKLMQFTGLHDKNGKEIWEGDIVHVERSCGLYPRNEVVKMPDIYVYNFDDGGFAEGNEYEVIGNIYESPDLLKKE